MRRIIIAVSLLVGLFAARPAQAALIKASNVNDQSTIGYLQLTGAQDRYILGSSASAHSFDLAAPLASLNSFIDTDAPASHPYLAGLSSPGVELLPTNSNAAILGGAPVTTASGSTPQSGGSVSIPGSEYETTICSISVGPGGFTVIPNWVNHDGSQPAMSPVWDPIGQVIYLTANPAAVILNHPGSQTVTLTYLGELPIPEPSSFALLSVAGVGFLTRKRRMVAQAN